MPGISQLDGHAHGGQAILVRPNSVPKSSRPSPMPSAIFRARSRCQSVSASVVVPCRPVPLSGFGLAGSAAQSPVDHQGVADSGAHASGDDDG